MLPNRPIRLLIAVAASLALHASDLGHLIAYTVPVVPWTFPDNPDRGVAPEYLHYLFQEAGVPLRFDTMPYVRVVRALETGENVAAMLIPDTERDRFAIRLCEVTTIRSGVVYRREDFAVMDKAHLVGKSVGLPHGTHALDTLAGESGVNLYPVESVEQGVKMLLAGRLDATFLSSPGSRSVMQAAGLSERSFAWQELESSPVVIYISRKSPLAADADAMARLKHVCEGKARPVMDALMQKYR
ncbi:MAG: transporter substrate-binding domain-containing protein [Burkholderiales bacterium]|nr:transporter substrate-binding domain-containing protein [Burkholderiales bacterium]